MWIRSARIKGPSNPAENKLIIDANIVNRTSLSDCLLVNYIKPIICI